MATPDGGDAGCDDASLCKERVVFVTSGVFAGTLGCEGDAGGAWGVACANLRCQEAANSDGGVHPRIKGRPFVAWLSTTDAGPAGHFEHSTGPYVRPDSAPVAPNWTALVSGTLQNPINQVEDGGALGADGVWTGTSAAGLPAVRTCSDWSSSQSLDRGIYGDPFGTTGGTWTYVDQRRCSELHHLCCFEK